jgi:hypothetical protein
MRMKIAHFSSLLLAFVLAASAFYFDSSALAGNATSQNANSSTTTMENTNTGKTSRGRGRRHKRTPAAAPAETGMPATDETAGPTEQTDLSGTYTGNFDCSDAGVSGETTLTVTGNQFTLSDGKSGRIVAATTRGYTGATMQFGEFTVPVPGQAAGAAPVIVSMRAKKSGDRLTLTPVPGERHVCSFTPAGASGGMRHRRGRAAAPPTAPEPAAAPEAGAAPEAPAGGAPSSRRRGRRGRRANPNINMNTNANDNTGEAAPTPTPAPPRK